MNELATIPPCTSAACRRPIAIKSRGLCRNCYARWRRRQKLPLSKSPEAIRAGRIEFFWANVERRGDDECWPWKRKPGNNGQAQMRGFTGNITAYRFAYELLVGTVPVGLQLDHTCHNAAARRGECPGGRSCPHRMCCNPTHLDPVPGAVNRKRGITARPANRACATKITHCPQGHEYTPENTYVNRGCRNCRECTRQAVRRRRDRIQPDRRPPAHERTHCPQGHPYDAANTTRTATGERRCKQCNRDAARRAYWKKRGIQAST